MNWENLSFLINICFWCPFNGVCKNFFYSSEDFIIGFSVEIHLMRHYVKKNIQSYCSWCPRFSHHNLNLAFRPIEKFDDTRRMNGLKETDKVNYFLL